MAGPLRRLLRAGDCQRAQPQRHRLSPGLRPAGPGQRRPRSHGPTRTRPVTPKRSRRGRKSSSGSRRPAWYGLCAKARMGFLGHTYPGMLDMYSDFTMITAQTGMHVEVLEMCDLAKLAESVTDAEKRAKLEQVTEMFVISEDSPADPLARKPRPEQLDVACRVAVAQEKTGSRVRPRRADLLLSRPRRQRLRATPGSVHPRPFAAHRPRHPVQRRRRHEDGRGHEDLRHPGRRWQLQRDRGGRLQPRHDHPRPRRPVPHRHRRRQADAPRHGLVPRQMGHGRSASRRPSAKDR